MKKPHVFVTRPLPLGALAKLQERCLVDMNAEARHLSTEELLARMAGCEAVVVVGSRINEEICQAVKGHCRIFAGYGVGYDNIDVTAATRHGIVVTNTPDVVSDATADLAWALLLAVARRVVECDQFVRSGQKGWGPANMLGTQVSGKTLGILGAGRIGTAVAQRGKGFNMQILYSGRRQNREFEQATGGKYVDKETLLQQADFLSVHVPLSEGTRHYIGAAELALMKETAILINTARGPVIDEQALVHALRHGIIGGAGLDVFEREPELMPGLNELTNVVLTPHIGTSTLDTRVEMGEMCTRNIFALLDGKVPPNCLNIEVISRV